MQTYDEIEELIQTNKPLFVVVRSDDWYSCKRYDGFLSALVILSVLRKLTYENNIARLEVGDDIEAESKTKEGEKV